MNNPEFRNPEKFQVLSHREWIRNKCPNGANGFVAEDLDLLVRTYGHSFGCDAVGQFMLCELKYRNCRLGRAQIMTFRLIDTLCRKGDDAMGGARYKGYFLVQYPDEDWDLCETFSVNNITLLPDQLRAFLCFDTGILSHILTHGTNPLA